jgi:hypothetical protein
MLIGHINLNVLIRHFLQKLNLDRNLEYSLGWSVFFDRSITIHLFFALCIYSISLRYFDWFFKGIHIIIMINKRILKCRSKAITMIVNSLIYFRNNADFFLIRKLVVIFCHLCIFLCYLWTIDIMSGHAAKSLKMSNYKFVDLIESSIIDADYSIQNICFAFKCKDLRF